MARSAIKVSAEDNLFVYNPKSSANSNSSEKAERIVQELTSEVDFIQSTNAFFYNNRVRLTITSKASLPDFILLKGLIEFHRSRYFIFTYNKQLRTIEADLPESEFESFKSFFQSLSRWFREEQKFKSVLRNIIDFELKYKTQRNQLYSALLK
jgi:hypothetical protein